MSSTDPERTPAPPTRLTLIRHGESQVMLDGIVGGHEGCTGLSDLGRRQAEALRARLERTGELAGAAHLYASVLPRAIETAQIIAPAVGDLEILQECDLCEIHPGEADGLKWDEWREQFASKLQGRGPFARWAPGAETWAEFAVRVGSALQDLAANHEGEHVVVACHGGVIEASLVTFGRLPIHRDWRTQIDNTSITEWELRGYEDWDRGARWTLVRFNDAAHLAGL